MGRNASFGIPVLRAPEENVVMEDGGWRREMRTEESPPARDPRASPAKERSSPTPPREKERSEYDMSRPRPMPRPALMEVDMGICEASKNPPAYRCCGCCCFNTDCSMRDPRGVALLEPLKVMLDVLPSGSSSESDRVILAGTAP